MQINRTQAGVTVVIGATKLVYSEYKQELKAIKQEFEAKSASIETQEEYEQLEADTISKVIAVMGAEVNSEYKKKVAEDFYVNLSGQYFLKADGKVIPTVLPEGLVEKIQEHIANEEDYSYLVKFWVNLHQSDEGKPFEMTEDKAERIWDYIMNPFVDQEIVEKLLNQGFTVDYAIEQATTTECSITSEGLIAGYKVVEARNYLYDFDEEGNVVRKPKFKTTKLIDEVTGEVQEIEEPHFAEDEIFEPAMIKNGDYWFKNRAGENTTDLHYTYSVGCTHTLPSWDMIDCDDNHHCVKGLHVN